MNNLTIRQLSISIEHLIDPINTKQKAFNGSCDDIKNYIIVRDNISNEGIGSSVNGAFKKLLNLIIDLISRIKNKILLKINNIKPFTKEYNDLIKSFIQNIFIPIKDIFRKIDKEQLPTSTRNEVINDFIDKKLTAMGYTGDLYDLSSYVKALCNYTYTNWHMGVLSKLNSNSILHSLDSFADAIKTKGTSDEIIITAYDSAFKIKPGNNAENNNFLYINEPSATALLIVYQMAGKNINQIENYYDEVSRQFSSGEINKFVLTSPDNTLCKKGMDLINKLDVITNKLYENTLGGISQEAKLRMWTVTSLVHQLAVATCNTLSIPNIYGRILLHAAKANKKSESK